MYDIQLNVGIEVTKVEIDIKRNTLTAHARALLNQTVTPLQSYDFTCKMPMTLALKDYIQENIEQYMALNLPDSKKANNKV